MLILMSQCFRCVLKCKLIRQYLMCFSRCMLMSQCWDQEQENRPEFRDIITSIERHIESDRLGYDTLDHSTIASAQAAVVKRATSNRPETKHKPRVRMRDPLTGTGSSMSTAQDPREGTWGGDEVNVHVAHAMADVREGRSGMEREEIYDDIIVPTTLPKR